MRKFLLFHCYKILFEIKIVLISRIGENYCSQILQNKIFYFLFLLQVTKISGQEIEDSSSLKQLIKDLTHRNLFFLEQSSLISHLPEISREIFKRKVKK